MTSRHVPPVAITARLNYTATQARQLDGRHRRAAEVRPLLRRFHDELLQGLAPHLSEMRTQGMLLDHASSWLLGEFVAHAPPNHADAAEARLRSLPELRDVGRPPARRQRAGGPA